MERTHRPAAVVASVLGHSSPAVTHAHYIDGVTARRTRTRRGSGVAAEPALRVVRTEPANAGATAAEPGDSGDFVGNGQ